MRGKVINCLLLGLPRKLEAIKVHVAIFVGTRPEAIKMAPVVKALKSDPRHRVSLCTTGQHREMLAQALSDFGLKSDVSIDIMVHDQTLAGLTSKLIHGCDQILQSLSPDWVLVQGDTTTVMAASMAAFYRNIKVGHVEAGLRSHEKRSPFPEEANRKVTSVLADIHFCPTNSAQANLINEGIQSNSILVTGNTVIDAVLWTRENLGPYDGLISKAVLGAFNNGKKIVLVTCHRRENFGDPLLRILNALRHIALLHPECFLVFPVHLNPNVRSLVYKELSDIENIILIEPCSYRSLVALMDISHIVLTDSGGLQEEAPALNKPVLVLREVTERPEGVEVGAARLAGTAVESIVNEVERLLTDGDAYNAMANAPNPYGDGHASDRIKKVIYG
jgi:UDP-N-acetylglucosamine 2-epimerase (non-hydrolysing)